VPTPSPDLTDAKHRQLKQAMRTFTAPAWQHAEQVQVSVRKVIAVRPARR
jgi:hypothetical protein